MFSIYKILELWGKILPEILELWGANLITDIDSKKLEKVTGK